MSENSIEKVVIVGGGTAGWMAAASLSQYLQDKKTTVTLIESPDIKTIGVGEATIPGIIHYNNELGIDEREFVKATRASFKLGIQFENWHTQNSSFFHPFSDYGVKINQVEFHHYLNRLQASGEQVDLQDYSLSRALAQKGKFGQPRPNAPKLADYAYAYHFDATLYAHFLRDLAVKQGTIHIEANVNAVNLDPDTGFITSVLLKDGQVIDGDLFIDCSGFKSLLIEEALQTGYDDWSKWLPCDRAIAIQTESVAEPAPYTRSIAQDAGWQWQIPLQHRVGNGYIYCSKFEDDKTAEARLLANIDGTPISQARNFKFITGRRKQIWNKNCFALGLSTGFLEPLESTSISLIQTAIHKLLSFFPDKSFNPHDRTEVNRLHNLELEHIRDFLILHYKSTQRDDTEFWRYCKAIEIPDSLAHKINLFESRGHVVMYENESFEEASWLSMYYGFNRIAQRYDVRTELIDIETSKNQLAKMKNSINETAEHAPSHQNFIDKHCKASL